MTLHGINGRRDPELSRDPNKYAPANGLAFENGVAHLRGYQEFTFEPRLHLLHAINPQLIAKDAVAEHAFSPGIMAGRTVLDLGGNNGFFGFKALAAGASSVSVVDIDDECILNLQRVRARFPDIMLEAHRNDAETWNRPADVVLAFALVHWLYSCTAQTLSLERMIGRLASLARDALVVEWVDGADPLVQAYHHTEVTERDSVEPYDFNTFLRALSAQFSDVELLGELSATRRVYLATRGRLPDLSWAAPLLFPKETLLTSRMLWAENGVEFWSRVYRADTLIYRQCTPELGRREVAGARVLGIPVEILEQHEDWWLLRTSFFLGETLDERMARGQPAREEILRVLLALVDQVRRLKQANVVHRDLHPANIIVTTEGGMRIIDWGWAHIPGMAEVSPAPLGCGVGMPATRTVITVRPPEASGDDLFAVGSIAAWMNRDHDPEVDFLAAWLANPDYRLRLANADLARELILRLLRQPGTNDSSVCTEEPGGQFEQVLLRFSAGVLQKLRFAEENQATLLRQKDELLNKEREILLWGQGLEQALTAGQAQQRDLEQALATSQAQQRDLEQALATSQAQQRNLEQALVASSARTEELAQTVDWMKRSRFWKVRNLWFACKRGLRIS